MSATAQNYVYEINVKKDKKLNIPVISKEKMEQAKAVMEGNQAALAEYHNKKK